MRHGTYSIVALDPATGELGVAVQSHWFSVGPLCAWARAGVGAVATQSVVEPAYGPNALDRLHGGRQRPAGARRAARRRPARPRPPGRGDRRPRRDRDPHRQGLHRARRPRERRAPQLPGQHDGPRHGPAGDVRRVRRRPRALCRTACSPRSTRPRAKAETSAAASRRRWSSSRPTASPGAGPSTCAWRTTARRWTSCAASSRSSARTTSRAPATSCSRRAGPRRPAASTSAPPSSPRTRDELLFWSGLAIAQAGDLDGGVAAVRRAAEENPNWLVLLDRLSPEFAPAGEAVRQQIT